MLREGTDFLASSFPTYTKEFSIEGAVVPGLLLCSKQGVAAKALAVGFCLGCGLFGSYNSL